MRDRAAAADPARPRASTRALVKRTLDVFVVDTTDVDAATVLVDELRRAGLATDRAYDARSMKSQMKVADRSGARLALIVGPQELAAGEVTIRDLRGPEGEQSQRRVSRDDLVAALAPPVNDVSMPENLESTALRDLLCASVGASDVGRRLSVCGWVAKRREHGEHLAFLDIRDRSGILQAVVDGLGRRAQPSTWCA